MSRPPTVWHVKAAGSHVWPRAQLVFRQGVPTTGGVTQVPQAVVLLPPQ